MPIQPHVCATQEHFHALSRQVRTAAAFSGLPQFPASLASAGEFLPEIFRDGFSPGFRRDTPAIAIAQPPASDAAWGIRRKPEELGLPSTLWHCNLLIHISFACVTPVRARCFADLSLSSGL